MLKKETKVFMEKQKEFLCKSSHYFSMLKFPSVSG